MESEELIAALKDILESIPKPDYKEGITKNWERLEARLEEEEQTKHNGN